MTRQAAYLQSRFPDITLGFSLPRIREAPEGFDPPYRVDDATLVRMYCALRLAFPQAELVLSTRESPSPNCTQRVIVAPSSRQLPLPPARSTCA